jgi:V8-like Glu-specific endopeptidase
LILVSFSRPTVNVQRGKFRKVQSTYVAGTRTVPNPAYQQAEIIYDQANRNVNRIIAASQTNPYAGFAMPRARKNLEQAAQLLASTPQYIEQQIRKDYSFTEFDETYQYQDKWKVAIVLPKYGMEFANRGTTRKSLTRMGQKGMHEGDVWAVRYGGPNKEESVIQEGMTESASTIAELITTPFVWQSVGDKSIENQATVAKKLLARMYKITTPLPVTKTLQDVNALKSLPQSRREKMISAALAEFSPSLKATTVAAGTGGRNSSVQNTVGNIYERVLPSVVTIMTESGHGSGFFVTENTVVTNFHVISGENVVRILLQDKREILGRVKNFDPNLDLALIEALAEHGPPALPLSAAPPRVGEHVLAIGSPLRVELEGTLTDGLVSALRDTENGVLIQTNAALNPGNSGGPLLNMRGEVVGINTLKLVKEGVEGLGFAVSAEEVKRILGGEATEPKSTEPKRTKRAAVDKGLKECEQYYKTNYPTLSPDAFSMYVKSCVAQPDHIAHKKGGVTQ